MRKRDSTSKIIIIIVASLLISVATLAFIYAYRISMQGYGMYLYFIVMLSAVVYIVSTVIYVLLSVRKD